MEENLKELIELIYKHIGQTKVRLDRNTRLYKDLKIDGDDAWELIKDFSDQYNVDMTYFKFSDYFSPEGIDIIGAIVNLFRRKPKLKDLTIGDLEKAIIVGKLE